MSKKSDDSEQFRTAAREITMCSPGPPTSPDSFATPAGDSFAPLTPDQEVSVWSDLRELLSGLVDKPATPADRDEANSILNRLGLAAELAPMMMVAIREASELQLTIDQGVGQAEKAAAALKECRIYVNVVASTTPEEARRTQAERECLQAEHVTTSRLAEAATRAAGGVSHLHNWLPELFGLPNWSKDRDEQGRLKTGGGRLGCTICPSKTAQAASELSINPSVPDSWKTLRRPEPTPGRRRFRTQQLTSPSPVSALGQNRF